MNIFSRIPYDKATLPKGQKKMQVFGCQFAVFGKETAPGLMIIVICPQYL